MQPSGLLSINGAAITTPFLKRLLDRFHVKPILFKREGYKNFVNQFTHVSPQIASSLATLTLALCFVLPLLPL